MIARPDLAVVLRSWVGVVKRGLQSSIVMVCWTHPRLQDTKTCRTRGCACVFRRDPKESRHTNDYDRRSQRERIEQRRTFLDDI